MFSDRYHMQNSDPYTAIQQCLDLVDDESKITIDVLLLAKLSKFEIKSEHHSTTQEWFRLMPDDHGNSFSNFMRGRDISY